MVRLKVVAEGRCRKPLWFVAEDFTGGIARAACQARRRPAASRRIRSFLHSFEPSMLWVKSFHLIFVTSWFAGLFYLPRIFVNLAIDDDGPARERLLVMARKLYRFTTILAVPAVLLGLWLFVGYGIGLRGPGNGWMHVKLLLVLLVIGYHQACGSMLRKFERGANKRPEKFFRLFNESAVALLAGIVILVIVKPF